MLAGLLRELGFHVTMLAAGVVPCRRQLRPRVRLSDADCLGSNRRDDKRSLVPYCQTGRLSSGCRLRRLAPPASNTEQCGRAAARWQGLRFDCDAEHIMHLGRSKRKRRLRLATPHGRVALAELRLLIITEGAMRIKPVIAEADYSVLPRERFGTGLEWF
jgi:hypothetical protein